MGARHGTELTVTCHARHSTVRRPEVRIPDLAPARPVSARSSGGAALPAGAIREHVWPARAVISIGLPTLYAIRMTPGLLAVLRLPRLGSAHDHQQDRGLGMEIPPLFYAAVRYALLTVIALP